MNLFWALDRLGGLAERLVTGGQQDADGIRDRLLTEAHAEVIERGREHELGPAPTTLSIALVRPAQDLLLHASVGDSHVFVAPRDARQAVRDLGWASTGRRRTFFLGEEFTGG